MMYLGIALTAYLHQQGQIPSPPIENIRIDTVAPTSTIDGVEFDVDNGAFIISGDLFGTIDRAADDDVVAQLIYRKRMGY